jgi:hypothetical protein
VKRVSYAESTFGTDDHLADLVLEYARVLAREGASDTITIPGRIGTGEIEPISLLVGPASQITAWAEQGPFGGEVQEAVMDLERRIRALTASIEPSPDDPGASLDEFDDLA